MIVQAISLLDDFDKELKTYAMRLREWYGWHFTELAKIVQENIFYAKTVKLMGDHTNAAKLDFSEVRTRSALIANVFKERFGKTLEPYSCDVCIPCKCYL